MVTTHIGQVLAYLLKELSSTQDALAQNAVVSRWFLSRISHNPYMIPAKRNTQNELVDKLAAGLSRIFEDSEKDSSLVESFKKRVESQLRQAIELDVKMRMPEPPAFLRSEFERKMERQEELDHDRDRQAPHGGGERSEGSHPDQDLQVQFKAPDGTMRHQGIPRGRIKEFLELMESLRKNDQK